MEDALARMTLEEKVGMTTAQSKFSSRGVPRLGIPEVLWDDWDQAGWTNDSCTAFPALINLAATWTNGLRGAASNSYLNYHKGA